MANAVINANPGFNSVAALLYNNFAPSNPGTSTGSDGRYVLSQTSGHTCSDYSNALCLDTGSGGLYYSAAPETGQHLRCNSD